MKKFVFKLDRILSYRELIQDEKKKNLILKNQILFQEEERLKYLEEEVKNNKLLDEGELDIDTLILIKQYAVYLSEEIDRQRQVIEKAKENVEIAKNEYLEASKDAKALQILKEKQATEYKKILLKEEEKELDSMATERFHLEEL